MISRNRRDALRLLALAASIPLFWQILHTAHAEPFAPTRFTVAVEGRGPDVIMIPGLASSSAVWRPQAERLKARYRVHLVQVAGFAGTPAGANASGPIVAPTVEELAAYIRANGIENPAIIGHSMGGLMGLMLADKHPESVGRLMIVDALPFFGVLMGPDMTVEKLTAQAAAMRDRTLAGGQQKFAASEPATMATLIKSKGPQAQAAITAAQDSDHAVVARAMYEDLTTDMRPRLSGIKTQTVVLYPFDAVMGIPPERVDALYQSAYAPLPNKRLVRIDNAFHFIQVDQPEPFDREVQAFLNAH